MRFQKTVCLFFVLFSIVCCKKTKTLETDLQNM